MEKRLLLLLELMPMMDIKLGKVMIVQVLETWVNTSMLPIERLMLSRMDNFADDQRNGKVPEPWWTNWGCSELALWASTWQRGLKNFNALFLILFLYAKQLLLILFLSLVLLYLWRQIGGNDVVFNVVLLLLHCFKSGLLCCCWMLWSEPYSHWFSHWFLLVFMLETYWWTVLGYS